MTYIRPLPPSRRASSIDDAEQAQWLISEESGGFRAMVRFAVFFLWTPDYHPPRHLYFHARRRARPPLRAFLLSLPLPRAHHYFRH